MGVIIRCSRCGKSIQVESENLEEDSDIQIPGCKCRSNEFTDSQLDSLVWLPFACVGVGILLAVCFAGFCGVL